jgi:hypothetical protein
VSVVTLKTSKRNRKHRGAGRGLLSHGPDIIEACLNLPPTLLAIADEVIE